MPEKARITFLGTAASRKPSSAVLGSLMKDAITDMSASGLTFPVSDPMPLASA